MLLDALLAATDRLIITYTGNDERTNLERPPAVPVAELLDVVDRTVRTGAGPDAPAAREQILVRHPLQPFDPRNFRTGELTADGPWSFDAVALGGARALSSPRHDTPPFLPAPLPASDAELIELADVIRFVEHPCRAFLRSRLGISVRESLDEVQDALPVELGRRSSDGGSASGCSRPPRRRRARGVRDAPSSRAGRCRRRCSRRPCSTEVTPIVERDRRRRAAARRRGSGDLGRRQPRACRTAGRSPAPCRAFTGTRSAASSYSRVRPRDRLAAWVRLLALTAARPGESYRSAVIGRARSGVWTARRRPSRGSLPLGARARRSRQLVAILVDLYDRGMREPLPLACQTSAAYADAARPRRGRGRGRARRLGDARSATTRRTASPSTCSSTGGALPFAELLAQTPRADEQRDDVDAVRDDPLRPLRAPAVGRPARPRGAERPMTATRSQRLSPAEFDLCGPLPDRGHRARGQRRHRQDLHDRRARRAVCRRGHAARARCC